MPRSVKYSAPRPRTPTFVVDSDRKLLSSSSRKDSSGSGSGSNQNFEDVIAAQTTTIQPPLLQATEEACILNNTVILIETPAELEVTSPVTPAPETQAAASDNDSVKIDVSDEPSNPARATSGSGESTTAEAPNSIDGENRQVKAVPKIESATVNERDNLDVVQVELRVYWIAVLNIVFLALTFGHANRWKIIPAASSLVPLARDITTTIGSRIAFAALLHLAGGCTFILYIFTWLAGLTLIHRGEPLPSNSAFGRMDSTDETARDWRPRLLTIASIAGCVGATLVIAAAAIAPTSPVHVILLGISLVFQFLWGMAYLITMATIASHTRIGKCVIVMMWLALVTTFYGTIGVWFFLNMQNMLAVSISAACIIAGLIAVFSGVAWLNFREHVTISCK